VSSSPEEIVEPLAHMLLADRWIATRPKVVDGIYTGELDFYAYGPYKVQAINELARELDIHLERSFAYSDSITDLPMLECVGHPIAINPDRELRRVAAERNWPVDVFRHPVPMRDRLPHLRRPDMSVTNGLAAAGAVAFVAAFAWWLAKRNAERVE
jgi:phosphoserine phosphatase